MPRAEATGDSRRRANWQARRQAIVDTSARVFARRGYHATGITELCAANELGKGALYHYIGSKEELLAAIHDRVMDEVMLGADRVAEAGGSPSEQLAMLGDELLDVIHRYPDHVWVFLHEFPALTGERAEQFRERRRGVRASGSRRSSKPASTRASSVTCEPRLTAMAWLGMHNYTYLWLQGGRALSARDVAKPFAEIFMRGITNPAADTHDELSGRRVPAVDDDVPIRSSSGRVAREVGVRARRGRRPSRARGGGAAAMASSASGGRSSWIAERNVPGHTQLTRIPSRAYSTAATFASWITAALVAQYGAACDHAVNPATDAVSTIEPDRCGRMTATAARMPLTAPRRLTRKARSQSSVARLWIRPFGESTPALLISTSR